MHLTWKSISSITMAAGLALAAAALPATAEPATVGLTKWVQTADGPGYDPAQPVRVSAGSSEQVRIPVEYVQPERQFRSSWVATVNQLNIAKPTDEADFRAQYTRILDRFEQNRLNAMIFQVRPAQDAWYSSELNPWSQFLSGKQGRDPGYDPLAWMVEQTHARGMEYHAWLNPYRVTTTSITSAAMLAALGMTAAQASALTPEQAATALAAAGVLAPDNYAVQHPDQVLMFNGALFLDPGEPAVREHVVATVREIVEKYDVDGIHFDDYFYPYRTTVHFGDAGEDRSTFERYGLPAGYADTVEGIAQWRRDNVTTLVTGVHDELARHDAASGTEVQFGVSPFGIWEHKSVDPRGSDTPASSSSTYSQAVFADTRGWVKAGLLDYIVPQIYWSFDQAAAPYGELARWWNETVAGTGVRLYIGHADYKHLQNGATEVAWTNPDEVPNQLLYDQTLANVSGEVFYGYNDIVPGSTAGLTGAALVSMQAKNASIERIFGDLLTERVLAPADPTRADAALRAPTGVEMDGTVARWSDGSPGATRAFAVYLDGALQRVLYVTGAASYELELGSAGAVTVAALDRAENETERVAPAAEVVPPTEPDPEPVVTDPPTAPAESTTTAIATDGRLADTGSDALPIGLIAAGLVAIGALAALAGRVRRHSARENSEARAT